MLLNVRLASDHIEWEIAVHLAIAGDVYDSVFLCCPFSHKMSWMGSWTLVLIESVSEGFPTYSLK